MCLLGDLNVHDVVLTCFYWTALLEEGESRNFCYWCSATQPCPTLCDPMDCSMSGFPVLHHLPEVAQILPLSWWCRPTISSCVIPFSSCPQSFPASGSFPMSPFPGLFPETNSSVILRSWQREEIRVETRNSVPINSEWYSIWLKPPLHHGSAFLVRFLL